jgi:hypothetical protein
MISDNDDPLNALSTNLYYPSCEKYIQRINREGVSGIPEVRRELSKSVKKSFKTYNNLVQELKVLPFFDIDVFQACRYLLRRYKIYGDDDVSYNLGTYTSVYICNELSMVHKELVRARNGYNKILTFLLTYKDISWGEIPKDAIDVLDRSQEVAGDGFYPCNNRLCTREMLMMNNNDEYLQWIKEHWKDWKDFTYLQKVKLMHDDARRDGLQALRKNLQHDEDILTKSFPLPLTKEEMEENRRKLMFFSRPPLAKGDSARYTRAYVKRKKGNAENEWRQYRTDLLRTIARIPSFVPAENLAFDNIYLNCGQFIQEVLRRDHSVLDPAVVTEFAESVYFSTMMYIRFVLDLLPLTYGVVNDERDGSISSDFYDLNEPYFLERHGPYNKSDPVLFDYAYHSSASYYIKKCKKLVDFKRGLKTKHATIGKILTFLSKYKNTEYANIPAEEIANFREWTSDFSLVLNDSSLFQVILKNLESEQNISADLRVSVVNDLIVRLSETWKREGDHLDRGVERGLFPKCHLGSHEFLHFDTDFAQSMRPRLMLRSAETSLAVLVSHVPYLEIYGYNGGLSPVAHDDNAGPVASWWWWLIGGKKTPRPVAYLEALQHEVSNQRSIIERREGVISRAERSRRGITDEMQSVCAKIYAFTQGLIHQRQMVVSIVKDLDNTRPLQQPGNIIDADGNSIRLEKANIYLLNRLIAHDDAILAKMGIRNFSEDDRPPSRPQVLPQLRLYSYVEPTVCVA